MSRPLVSVVLATYQRAHLLRRSLECYRNQRFDKTQFELVVIDDHSTDNTKDLVTDWSQKTGIAVTYLLPSPKNRGWRDCGAVLNYGIRASQGKHIILTHPEVMPGRFSVMHCYNALEDAESKRNIRTDLGYVYACCPIYYLTQQNQDKLDTVPWAEYGNLAVRKLPEFYVKTGGHPDYEHDVTDQIGSPGFHIPQWESWVFGGCSRETWGMLGGMLVSQEWGSVDVGWLARRRTLGITTETTRDPEAICCHQNHDGPSDTPTPRIEAPWVQELGKIKLQIPEELRYPAVDHLGWG